MAQLNEISPHSHDYQHHSKNNPYSHDYQHHFKNNPHSHDYDQHLKDPQGGHLYRKLHRFIFLMIIDFQLPIFFGNSYSNDCKTFEVKVFRPQSHQNSSKLSKFALGMFSLKTSVPQHFGKLLELGETRKRLFGHI